MILHNRQPSSPLFFDAPKRDGRCGTERVRTHHSPLNTHRAQCMMYEAQALLLTVPLPATLLMRQHQTGNLAGHLDPHSAERVLSMKFLAAIHLPTRRFISIPTQETGIKRMALVIWSKWEWLFSYNHYISFGAVASFLLGCDEDINWHIMAPHPPSYQSGAENLPQQTT